jgi:hypothetical protein
MARRKPDPAEDDAPAAGASADVARPPVRPDKPWPATTVALRPIGTVREYERNPRLHSERQVGLIARSLQEFGWTNPLLVSEDGVLIAGHARYLAAKELGLSEVPVMVARGWTDAQVRAYTIADNQMAITGSSFDPTLLALEIEGLRLDGFDLALTGFEPFELDAMSAVPDMTPRDPNALWEGMPEFTHEDQTSLHKVIVHLASAEALRAFAGVVGQTITEKTRAIWYPAAERGTYADKRWVGEEAPEEEGGDLPA